MLSVRTCGRFARVASLFSAIAVACLTSPSVARASIIIDDFSSPSGGSYFACPNAPGLSSPEWSTGNPVSGQQSAVTGILGGQRDLMLEIPNLASNAIGFDAYVSVGGPSRLGMATWGLNPAKLTLQYDGVDSDLNDAGLLGGIDLTVDGNDAFAFDFQFVDSAALEMMSLKAIVTSATGTTVFTGNSANLLGVPVHTSGFTYYLPFSAFSGAPASAFQSVESISFIFNDDLVANPDFALNSIVATASPVPEPSSIVLLAMAGVIAVAAGAARRRRKLAQG